MPFDLNCARATENFHSRIRGRSQNLQTSNIPHDGDYLFFEQFQVAVALQNANPAQMFAA